MSKLTNDVFSDFSYTSKASGAAPAFDINGFVTVATPQTVTGAKTLSSLTTFSNGTKFGPGKGFVWVDSGSVGPVDVGANGTASLNITFNSTAPSATGLAVYATPASGVGLDRLTYGAYNISPTGATIAVRNSTGTGATAIGLSWMAVLIQ